MFEQVLSEGPSYSRLSDFYDMKINPSEFPIQTNFVSVADAIMASDYFNAGNFQHFGINSLEDCLQVVPKVSAVLMCRFRDGELENTLLQCSRNPSCRYIIVQTLIGDDGYVSADTLKALPENIVRIYSKNVHYEHERLVPVPIGRDWRVTEEAFSAEFSRATGEPPRYHTYMNFSLETHPSREELFHLLKNEPWVTASKPAAYRTYHKSHSQYVTEMADHRFTLSPIGKAVDCYRTWDALFARSIPVLDKTAHSSLYQDLPAIIVSDWSQVNKGFLDQAYDQLTQQRLNLEKLTMKYWRQLIQADAQANF